MKSSLVCALAGACLTIIGVSAAAEVSTVRVFRQYTLPYLALMVMEDQKLIEKHAKSRGVDVQSNWSVVSSPAAVNDALLSGNLDFASAGANAFLTIWDKTSVTSNPVRGVCAYNASPGLLNTRNPNVKSIRDFTAADKIAVPAVKVSYNALILQMAAAKEFGLANYAKLDELTVSLPQAESTAALMSGVLEITANFSVAPYQYLQLKNPKIRTVLNSYDVLGGKATLGLVYTTKKFHDENPRIYAAFMAAYNEANDLIKRDPVRAAEIYQRLSRDKAPTEFIVAMLKNPDIDFDPVPRQLMTFYTFMQSTGRLKAKATNWKELFFPAVHGEPGS